MKVDFVQQSITCPAIGLCPVDCALGKLCESLSVCELALLSSEVATCFLPPYIGCIGLADRLLEATFCLGVDCSLMCLNITSSDQQAIRDMVNQSAIDRRFGSPIIGSFSKQNFNQYPGWELRQMKFNFTNSRTVWIYHVTSKQNSTIRAINYFDLDRNAWTGWIRTPVGGGGGGGAN